MPRGRFVSRSITECAQLASARASLEAALLFTWSIPHLDCEGRMIAGAMVVKGKIFPLRDDVPTEAIPGLWAELADAKLVMWYEVDGVQYVAFPAFEDHQLGIRKRREAPSRIPPPKSPNAKRLPDHSTPNSPRIVEEGVELLPIREVKNFPCRVLSSPPKPGGSADAPPPQVSDDEAAAFEARRAARKAEIVRLREGA